MLTKALGRSIDASDQRIVLLAPPTAVIPPAFDNVDVNPDRHTDLLMQMQRLRGSVYLQDGAIESHELSHGGRHQTPEDEKSWHILMVDESGKLTACIWYMEHTPNASFVDRLRTKHCPLVDDPIWRETLRRAVEHDRQIAQQDGVACSEAGGWAVANENRCISEGLVMALGCFSLSRALGDCLCISTATVRNGSATILRRLGGASLRVDGQTIPPYYDPRYKCEMELLRFDSRCANPKYAPFVEALRHKLTSAMVLAQTPQQVMSPAGLPLEAAASRLRIGATRVAAA